MRDKTLICTGGNKMKKLFLGTLLLALVFVLPIPTMAGVDVSINISLPPPIVFAGPPEMVVLPETNIYVVPDSDVDIFFYGGWWWRPWEGRWYRSHYYNSGWGYYQSVPSFYAGIPSGWRNDYREHRWRGQQWNYQRIPQQQVQRNWKGWEKNKHWEKQNTWGVPGFEASNAITTTVSRGTTKISGKTASTRYPATAIKRGQATAVTTSSRGS
jgi:hypothetical protein